MFLWVKYGTVRVGYRHFEVQRLATMLFGVLVAFFFICHCVDPTLRKFKKGG
jgi:hypothetical protein